MADSKIQWTDKVWNVVRGCSIGEHRLVAGARPGQVVHHEDEDRANNAGRNWKHVREFPGVPHAREAREVIGRVREVHADQVKRATGLKEYAAKIGSDQLASRATLATEFTREIETALASAPKQRRGRVVGDG